MVRKKTTAAAKKKAAEKMAAERDAMIDEKKAARRAAQKAAREIVDSREGAPPVAKPPPPARTGLATEADLAQLEQEQRRATPVRSDRVEARRMKQDINYDLGPFDQIVYRHKIETTIGIRLGPEKGQRFHCIFDRYTFVITQLLCEQWSENLPQDAPAITPEDICRQLERTASFGREFIMVAAPGFVPSEKVQAFNDRCLMSAEEKKIRMIQGARTRG